MAEIVGYCESIILIVFEVIICLVVKVEKEVLRVFNQFLDCVCLIAVTVFLAPPSLEALEQRLRGRGTETEEKILSRLETAKRELELAPTYDHIVINDDSARAAREINDILNLPVNE